MPKLTAKDKFYIRLELSLIAHAGEVLDKINTAKGISFYENNKKQMEFYYEHAKKRMIYCRKTGRGDVFDISDPKILPLLDKYLYDNLDEREPLKFGDRKKIEWFESYDLEVLDMLLNPVRRFAYPCSACIEELEKRIVCDSEYVKILEQVNKAGYFAEEEEKEVDRLKLYMIYCRKTETRPKITPDDSLTMKMASLYYFDNVEEKLGQFYELEYLEKQLFGSDSEQVNSEEQEEQKEVELWQNAVFLNSSLHYKDEKITKLAPNSRNYENQEEYIKQQEIDSNEKTRYAEENPDRAEQLQEHIHEVQQISQQQQTRKQQALFFLEIALGVREYPTQEEIKKLREDVEFRNEFYRRAKFG